MPKMDNVILISRESQEIYNQSNQLITFGLIMAVKSRLFLSLEETLKAIQLLDKW